jgi:phosphoenolpyruvate synthase/pyruvate phosphate dikinase
MENYTDSLLPFKRSSFFNDENKITFIGEGEIGGKAKGLLLINDILNKGIEKSRFTEFNISVPNLCIIRTKVFEDFIQRNDLQKIAFSKLPNERIAHAFQNAELPFEILGDLRSLISEVHSPLAIRSSSLLEDAKNEPFAGIYETKMTPNNQLDTTSRFKKLVEAIKFVYASTFFKTAKDYMKATNYKTEDERMAIIIQEVVGSQNEDLFYPHVSGVIRSHNYYSFGNSKPKDGVVNLALGLGKTIVENEPSWFFAPSFPKTDPPFNSIGEMMKNTQNNFWAVNMSNIGTYNPIKETEFLKRNNISEAESHNTLKNLVSTLDSDSGRIIMGAGKKGPRILTFAPILRLGEIRLTELIIHLIKISEQALNNPVEIEFALSLNENNIHKFGFLQVRPMSVSDEIVDLKDDELLKKNNLCSSPTVLGNGINNTITDIIYLKKQEIDSAKAHKIALEVEKLNNQYIEENKKYVLMGFGRWGTSDAWAGIPVEFGQISKAGVIVEAPLAGMNSELSQGSHFFHNLNAFKILYFSIPYSGQYPVDWEWMKNKKPYFETDNIIQIKLSKPLLVKVDGESGRGLINKNC